MAGLTAREAHTLLAALEEAAAPRGRARCGPVPAGQRQRNRDRLLETLTEAVAALLRQAGG